MAFSRIVMLVVFAVGCATGRTGSRGSCEPGSPVEGAVPGSLGRAACQVNADCVLVLGCCGPLAAVNTLFKQLPPRPSECAAGCASSTQVKTDVTAACVGGRCQVVPALLGHSPLP